MTAVREIVVGDIGGTNARFAVARIGAKGSGAVPVLDRIESLPAADHPDLASAFRNYAKRLGGAVPDAAAFAVAGPVRGPVVSFTNSSWRIERAGIADALGLKAVRLINDFGAMGHAVAVLPPQDFVHVCGPDRALPAQGPITVIGPGTGLGLASAIRTEKKGVIVVETEGSHGAFAPLDSFEQALHDRLLRRHGRVSDERIVCGKGLVAIHEQLLAEEGIAALPIADADLWAAALDGKDARAKAALDRFCLSYGAVAGDLALAQGAVGVALVGGLTQRMLRRLRLSGFAARFTGKGRYVDYMSAIPVRLVMHEQPGLVGAAAAFAEDEAEGG